jgi:hypothetical protein
MSTRLKPLLPLVREALPLVIPTLRQRAIGVATRLITEFTKGGKYRIPGAKYSQEVCKIFRIPLLPQEAPVTVAVKKLEQWRTQVNFHTVTDEDIEAVLPELESLVKTIRLAIGSKIVTSEQRNRSHNHCWPKERNTNPRPLHTKETSINPNKSG